MNCINQVTGENYSVTHGDCIEVVKTIPDEYVGFTVYSPPFESLYTYSDSERDLGNCSSKEEFWQHYKFLIREQFRITKPGRLCSVHCMNIPMTIQKDGFIGIRDFRGEIVRAFEEFGWIFHSEVCIWKDPVTAMQRTKAIGLLHKQLVKDSAMSRQGIPDYIVTFRKPGKNADPIQGRLSEWSGDDSMTQRHESSGESSDIKRSIDIWQRYASPVWMDINMSDTLQYRMARSEDDERHICPLQLQVIERCIQLWSKEGDIVFDPFSGIGSTGFVALKNKRRFIGIELKESYYEAMVRHLNQAVSESHQKTLF